MNIIYYLFLFLFDFIYINKTMRHQLCLKFVLTHQQMKRNNKKEKKKRYKIIHITQMSNLQL